MPRACRISSSPSSELTSETSRTSEISPSELISEISTDNKRFLPVVGTSAEQGAHFWEFWPSYRVGFRA